MRHPATQMDFGTLLRGLDDHVQKGQINRQTCSKTGLHIFCYSKQTVFEKVWNEFTLISRGLILDSSNKRIVSLPFPKFFNYGEAQGSKGFTSNFEVFEKIDGSLIIVYYYDGKWRTATKGSFQSEQAEWAANFLSYLNISALVKGDTYLFEATYPANKIVVPYSDERLTLLAAYSQDGTEYKYDDLRYTAIELGSHCVKKHDFSNLLDLVEHTKNLPFTQEGFVVRFNDGLRIKIKGDEYCRLHRAISKLTPLAIWEMMLNGGDIEIYKKELPEEFLKDFDNIHTILERKIDTILIRLGDLAETYKDVPNREIVTQLKENSPLLLSYRKAGENMATFMDPKFDKNNDLVTSCPRKVIFNLVRPRANVLDGYQPTTAMNHFNEEQE